MKKSCLVLVFVFVFYIFPTLKVLATSFTFSALGDIGATSATTKSLQIIPQKNIDLTLAVGDLMYADKNTENDWCNYIKGIVGTNYPFQLLVGNHEEDSKVDGYILNFTKCLPDKLNSTGLYGVQYYFDYPQTNPIARFIMTAPYSIVGGKMYEYYKDKNPENYIWLSNTIDDAHNKNIKWVIVGMHKNCITIGVKVCEVIEDMLNLLADKKVDLIIQGHDHTYQRSKQIKYFKRNTYDPSYTTSGSENETVYTKGNGPILVISGNPGGQSMYDINFEDTEKGYFVKALGNNMGINFLTSTLGYETGRGIVTYTVDDNAITATYNMTAKQKNGLPFSDTFTIKADSCAAKLGNGTCKIDVDYDGNNIVDIKDCILLIQKIFDSSLVLSSNSKPDLNKDGKLNLVDVVTFVQALLS